MLAKFVIMEVILMKKRLIIIILIIMFTATSIFLTSCVKRNNEQINNVQADDSNKASSNNKIQLWYYIFSKGIYEHEILNIVDKAKQFCEENKIPLEINGYDRDTMSKEDYILKRNIAMASGNVIIIDNIENLHTIAKHHADYTKVDNYNNLIDEYKDRFCIPLGVKYEAISLQNEVMQYYDISTEKTLMTYTDYLELKQAMKIKGAKFELNNKEYNQLVEYYIYKNNFLFLNEDDETLKDKNEFKKILKNIIIGSCNDILLYNDGDLKIKNEARDIYDKKSDIILDIDNFNDISDIIIPGSYNSIVTSSQHGKYQIDIINKSFYINPYGLNYSPNLYLYKKITDERIFDLVNHIANEETYIMIQTNVVNDKNSFIHRYAPVFKIDKAKEYLKLNDKLEFVDDYWSTDIRKLVSLSYEMIVKNEEGLKEIADAYFSNFDYNFEIKYFIKNTINDIAQKLSGDALSLEKFNPEDGEINKLIDKKVDEFVTNWAVYNN